MFWYCKRSNASLDVYYKSRSLRRSAELDVVCYEYYAPILDEFAYKGL